MNGRPLTMNQARKAHDRFYDDPGVTFVAEPESMDHHLRIAATGATASPKIWADAYLSAFASRTGATLVTFDKALAGRSGNSLLLS